MDTCIVFVETRIKQEHSLKKRILNFAAFTILVLVNKGGLLHTHAIYHLVLSSLVAGPEICNFQLSIILRRIIYVYLMESRLFNFCRFSACRCNIYFYPRKTVSR